VELDPVLKLGPHKLGILERFVNEVDIGKPKRAIFIHGNECSLIHKLCPFHIIPLELEGNVALPQLLFLIRFELPEIRNVELELQSFIDLHPSFFTDFLDFGDEQRFVLFALLKHKLSYNRG